MKMEALQRLQEWYKSQCDGDWEHSYGVHLETLDNPGWLLKIDLEGTDLWEKDLDMVQMERSEHDWIFYKIKERKFEAARGAMNLTEMIEIFKMIVEG